MSVDLSNEDSGFKHEFVVEGPISSVTVFDDKLVQEKLQDVIGNIPLLNGILSPSDVKLVFKLQPGFEGAGGEVLLEQKEIVVTASIFYFLLFLGSEYLQPADKFQLACSFEKGLVSFAKSINNQLLTRLYLDMLPDKLGRYYLFQFSQPLSDESLDDVTKLKYLHEVILNNISHNFIIAFLENEEKNTIIHEYVHLVFKKIISYISESLANDDEITEIYSYDEIWRKRQSHDRNYELEKPEEPSSLERIKRNLRAHRNRKISDWVKDLPETLAIKFVTLLQFRAFEENFVRAFTYKTTRIKDRYGRDFTSGYLSSAYFFSSAVPGVTKIKNSLQSINSAEELHSYIKQMVALLKQESIKIIEQFNISD